MAKRRRAPAKAKAAPSWTAAREAFAIFEQARAKQDARAMVDSLATLAPLLTAGADAQIAETRALNDRRARFVAEYLIDLNGAAACRRAGYHPKMAPALLAIPSVAAAIEAGLARQLDQAELTAQMVVDRLRLLGFQDVRRLFDRAGNLLPIHELSSAAAATIGGIDVVIRNISPADGHTDTVHKIKLIDPVQPLELLARKFGLLIEKVQISDERDAARVARLTAMRKRLDA